MAKATQTIKTVKIKAKTPQGTIKCNICGGKGYLKKPVRKKK